MKLYLDLRKAQISTSAKDTPDEEQSTLEYESSYSRRPEGEASGEAYSPDDPQKGGKWGHDSPNVAEVKAKLKNREKKIEDTEKSASTESSTDILKSFNTRLAEEKMRYTPNPTEVRFLTEYMGYSQEDIQNGTAVIKGRTRSLFNRWLCDRLAKSVDDLLQRRQP